jgi:Flp pilus assembly protein TadG
MQIRSNALPTPPKRQRGVAAVELGLLLLFLVTLAFGVAELGRAVYQYNAITKGVRDAARYLTQRAPDSASAVASAQNLVVYGSLTNTGQPAAPGLTTTMVTVCNRIRCPTTHDSGATGAGALGNGVNWVTVTVTGYPFVSLVSFVVPSVTFNPISATFTQIQ